MGGHWAPAKQMWERDVASVVGRASWLQDEGRGMVAPSLGHSPAQDVWAALLRPWDPRSQQPAGGRATLAERCPQLSRVTVLQ